MRHKGTVIGLVALVALVGGWIANKAVGQPDPNKRPTAALPQLPTLQPPSTPAPTPPTPGKSTMPPRVDTLTLPDATNAPRNAAGAADRDNDKDFNFDVATGRTNDNPTGRQEPAVSLEWIGPPTIKIGQPVTFQIIVKNVSPIAVQQVIVRNRLPAGVTVQQTEPKAFNDVNVLTWDLGTLEPRQERRIDLRLMPEVKGDLACKATVTFTGASVARIKVREPKLTLKATAVDKVLLGDVTTVTLTVTNPGDGSADHIKIKAALSEGLEHTRGKVVEFDLGNLGPNENRSVPPAHASLTPIAFNTCEASTAPVRQADPAEQQMPARSSSSKMACDSSPSKETLLVLDNRLAPAPLMVACGTLAVISLSN